MKRFVTLSLLALVVLTGCNHLPDPCGEPIEVPRPYWNPPKDIPALDPAPVLLVPSYLCVAEDRKMCVESTVEVITRDYLLLLADSEMCRSQYGELVWFIESTPEVSPPPPRVVPPLE